MNAKGGEVECVRTRKNASLSSATFDFFRKNKKDLRKQNKIFQNLIRTSSLDRQKFQKGGLTLSLHKIDLNSSSIATCNNTSLLTTTTTTTNLG